MTQNQHLSTGLKPVGHAASSSCEAARASVAADALPAWFTRTGPTPTQRSAGRRHVPTRSRGPAAATSGASNGPPPTRVGRCRMVDLSRGSPPHALKQEPGLAGPGSCGTDLTVRTGLHPHRITVRADMQDRVGADRR